ncbi:hypothetical protein GCM10017744_006720 [Streptomyces antimycoticus]
MALMGITAPDWNHCGDGATGDEPVGCTGIRIGGFERCLGHLGQEERLAYLATLTPGDDIDARGTEISGELLDELLDALCRPGEERPRCGRARFDKAVFTGAAHFNMVCFDKGAWFREARFRQDAVFAGALFGSAARFDGAEFHALANFDEVRCTADGTTPAGHLVFRGASFATGPGSWGLTASGCWTCERATSPGIRSPKSSPTTSISPGPGSRHRSPSRRVAHPSTSRAPVLPSDAP